MQRDNSANDGCRSENQYSNLIAQHNELGLHLLPSSAAAQAAPTPFTAVVEQ